MSVTYRLALWIGALGTPNASGILTYPILTNQHTAPLRAVAEEENPVTYYRMVVPRVLQDDWLRAAEALGASAPKTEDVIKAVNEYDQALEKISSDIGQFCAERRLKEQLAEIAAGGGAPIAAVSIARDCFDRLKSRSWPEADNAIEETWRRLTANIDPQDAIAVARADRAQATFLRGVYLRQVANPDGWSNTGEGVDLRDLLVNRVARHAVSKEFAGVAALLAGTASPSEDPRVAAGAAEVERIVAEYEAHSFNLVRDYFRAYRANAAKLPTQKEDLRAFSESRHKRSIDAARLVSGHLFEAIDQVSTALAQHVGIEAQGDWEDVAWAAVFPMLVQPELPTRAFGWIESSQPPADTLVACRNIYSRYLESRVPLRKQMIEALIEAKRTSAIPLGAESRKSQELETRMASLLASRQALSTAAVDELRATLDAKTSAELEKFLSAVSRQWDPARKWKNL